MCQKMKWSQDFVNKFYGSHEKEKSTDFPSINSYKYIKYFHDGLTSTKYYVIRIKKLPNSQHAIYLPILFITSLPVKNLQQRHYGHQLDRFKKNEVRNPTSPRRPVVSLTHIPTK